MLVHSDRHSHGSRYREYEITLRNTEPEESLHETVHSSETVLTVESQNSSFAGAWANTALSSEALFSKAKAKAPDGRC